MVSCWHSNAVVKAIIYFTINCFMEKKYWRNLQRLILKVEEMWQPCVMMYLLPSLWQMIDGLQIESFCLMGTDVVEWFSHCSGFVGFLLSFPVVSSNCLSCLQHLWKSTWFPVYLWLFLWMFTRAVFTFSVPFLCCPVVWQWGECKYSYLAPLSLWPLSLKFYF